MASTAPLVIIEGKLAVSKGITEGPEILLIILTVGLDHVLLFGAGLNALLGGRCAGGACNVNGLDAFLSGCSGGAQFKIIIGVDPGFSLLGTAVLLKGTLRLAQGL